jgi:cytochrome c biogenesis protein CcmG/thiol:disulfide interchange protein DsbE
MQGLYKPETQCRSASVLTTLLIACGLLILTGCAIYILANGGSAPPLAIQRMPQNKVSEPTPPALFRATSTPEQALVPPALVTPRQGQPTKSQLPKPPESNPQFIQRVTETLPGISTEQVVTDEIIAEVNHIAISKRALQIVLDADHAVALLLNTPVIVDHTAALERVLNGELVRQAAQPAGFVLDEATIQQSLQAFLTANQKNDSDLDQALTRVKLTRPEFVDYFGGLLLIDRFVRNQAEQLAVSDSTYLLQLQQTAHISFGPAAAPILAEPTTIVKASGAVTTEIVSAAPLLALHPDTPPFALPVLNATNMQTVTLNSLLGHPTVLSFWTTWCPYCKRQTPVLVEAYTHYAKYDIQFVGIDVKDAQDSVQTYITANHIPYPIALDLEGQIAQAYNVSGFPTTFFLDGTGHIIARHIGALTAEKLTEYLQQLVKPTN